jgi:alcohol dehydrogenase
MVAVHLKNGVVTVEGDADPPDPPPGHVLLKLRLAGICNTDLELQRGYYGFAGRPGHEFVAERVDTGERVVGEINLACERCDWCARGLGRHCPDRTVLGIVRHPGAFAQYLTLPERNLLAVPAGVSDDHAVFTEPVAAACEILDQVAIPPDEPVAVLGDGKLGLLIAQVLQLQGARVTIFGRHPAKMAIVSAVGVTIGNPSSAGQFGITVDATGSSAGLQQAVAMTRPRGILVMKSTVAARVEIDAAAIIVNEITLVGSRCGRFEPALGLIASGRLNLDPLIHARYSLLDAPIAFEHAARRGALKVLLTPD